MGQSDVSDEQVTPVRRKRYEAPCIEESGSFERLVLACGHTPPEQTFECQEDNNS